MSEEIVTAPKISVLVPIYNVERYLRQCIESLMAQTLTDIEIILLDDGSTDASGAICDEYVEKDARIRVIHKPNSGYGASMNIGLRTAQGEYIGILESDDWAEPDMYETLYSLAKQHDADVVKSNFYEYTEAGGDILMTILPDCDLERVINPKVSSNIFYAQPSIWSAIYNRRFLMENGIDFRESPGASYQDNGFNFKVWARAQRVWLTPRFLVHYRRDNEQASVKSTGKVFCMSDEWANIEAYMERYPEDKAASVVLRNHVKSLAYLWNWGRLSRKNKKAFEELMIREYREVMDRGEMRKRCYYSRDWIDLQRIVYRKSLRSALSYWGDKLRRVIIKPKIRNGQVTWRILGGLIKIKGASVKPSSYVFWESDWPSFYEEKA